MFRPLSLLSVVYGNLIKSGYEMLKSAFNAQGSRVIIVVVQVGGVGGVKLDVAAVQALRKNETLDGTQITTKIGVPVISYC
jgi:hypothetical protein